MLQQKNNNISQIQEKKEKNTHTELKSYKSIFITISEKKRTVTDENDELVGIIPLPALYQSSKRYITNCPYTHIFITTFCFLSNNIYIIFFFFLINFTFNTHITSISQ
eukprot:466631_1